MVNLGPLFGELKTCLRKDQFIFKKRLHGIKKINDETKQASIAQKIAEDISRSQQLREQRLAALQQSDLLQSNFLLVKRKMTLNRRSPITKW